MKKYIVYNDHLEGRESIDYEYQVGEFIRVNSVEFMKCKKKEIVNGELNQYFNSGRVVFD
jgi:hypothetical protein